MQVFCPSIVMILTKDHAPGSMSLGTANGLAELAQSISASIAPTVVRQAPSLLYCLSKQPAYRHAIPLAQLLHTPQHTKSSEATHGSSL